MYILLGKLKNCERICEREVHFRRQIIGFIADNGVSDAKSVSKAIVAYCRLQRHIGQIKWACKT